MCSVGLAAQSQCEQTLAFQLLQLLQLAQKQHMTVLLRGYRNLGNYWTVKLFFHISLKAAAVIVAKLLQQLAM